jgi:hypothetical protein
MFMNGNNNGYRPQWGNMWNQHPYYQGGNQGNSLNPNQPSMKILFSGKLISMMFQQEVSYLC